MAKYYSSTIQKGSSGADVKAWQEFLNSKGFSLAVDGIFGDNTETATKSWQGMYGLGADGIVGERTWGTAGFSNANNSVTPKINTTVTKLPTIDPAPNMPTFNTTATEKPKIEVAPDMPTFNTTVTEQPKDRDLPQDALYDTTKWDDTTKGKETLGNYNTAKDNVNNYGDFTYDDYTESDTVKQAGDALNAHLSNKPGEYQSKWQGQLDKLMNSIMNREKFSYDFNSDALYQQYKDKYIQQGKMAMADTMGQAAAMTGGYGNSYSASVGNQAYQAQLQNLNDIIPELYSMALDRYKQEGQDLYNQFGMVADRENQDYGRYRDTVSDYLTDRDYLTGRYDTERGFDYGKYVDDRNLDYTLHQDGYKRLLDSLGIASDDYYKGADMFHSEQATNNSVESQKFNDAMATWEAQTGQDWNKYYAGEDARQYANSLLQQGYQNEFGAWEANSNNAWKDYQASEEARQYANSLLQQGYQNNFGAWEANANNAWKEYNASESARISGNEEAWRQAEWDEDARRYAIKQNSTGAVSGDYDGLDGGGGTYDNGTYSGADVKLAQQFVGASADGMWGAKSIAAAKAKGYNSLEEVIAAMNKGQGEPVGWSNFDQEQHNQNVKENGGSYYQTALADLQKFKAAGKSNAEVMEYLSDMVGNSVLSRSEYLTLYNKYRDNRLN